jgi:hypothetical protein
VLDPDGFYDPLFTWLDGLVGTGFVSERGMAGVVRTTTVAAALDALATPQPAHQQRAVVDQQ